MRLAHAKHPLSCDSNDFYYNRLQGVSGAFTDYQIHSRCSQAGVISVFGVIGEANGIEENLAYISKMLVSDEAVAVPNDTFATKTMVMILFEILVR